MWFILALLLLGCDVVSQHTPLRNDLSTTTCDPSTDLASMIDLSPAIDQKISDFSIPDLIKSPDLIKNPDLAVPTCTKILGTEQNAGFGICIPYELIWYKDCQLLCPPTTRRGIFNPVYNDDTGRTIGVSNAGSIYTSGAVVVKNCVTPTFGTGYSFWLMQDMPIQPSQESVKGHVTCWWPTYAVWPGGPNNYLFNEGRYHYFK